MQNAEHSAWWLDSLREHYFWARNILGYCLPHGKLQKAQTHLSFKECMSYWMYMGNWGR